MGNKPALIKSEINQLFQAASQGEFQTKLQRIINMQFAPTEVIEYVTPQTIRDCIDTHFEYFVFLFQYLIDFIKDICKVRKNQNAEQSRQCRNSLLLLSKFITVLYEPRYIDLASRILWGATSSKVSIERTKKFTIIQANEEEIDNQEIEHIMDPNLLILMDSLVQLCFYPNFTIVPLQEQMAFNLENDEKLKSYLKFIYFKYGQKIDLKLIWRGFGGLAKYPNDNQQFTENRIIVLQCIVACLSQQVYRKKFFQRAHAPNMISPLTDNHTKIQKEKEFFPEDIDPENVLNDKPPSIVQLETLKQFRSQNQALLYLTTQGKGLLKELFASLWATILYHKYQFFWFQDNALVKKTQTRTLAQLSGQILIFLLSEPVNFEEIAEQLEFNREIIEVFKSLYEKQNGSNEQQYLNNDQNEDIQLKQPDFMTKSKKLDFTTIKFGREQNLTDCKLLFSNFIRESMCSIDDQSFYQRSIQLILTNISEPLVSESRLLTTTSFDFSGVSESLILVYFCLKNNKACFESFLALDEQNIQKFLNMLLYLQIKFAEGQLSMAAYLVTLEITHFISRLEKINKLMQKPVNFSICFNQIPNLAGTYGDVLVSVYSHLIYKYFSQKMTKSQSVINQVCDQKIEKNIQIIFQLSGSIRNLTLQSSHYFVIAFYAYFTYEFLLQDPKHALSLELLILSVNNILCYELDDNVNLITALTRRQAELAQFLKFTLTKQHLRQHFVRREQVTLSPKNRPISYLPTEKSELTQNKQIKLPSVNVSHSHMHSVVANVGKQTDLEDDQKQASFTHRLNTEGTGTNEKKTKQIRLSPEQELRFETMYLDWDHIVSSKIFQSNVLQRLKNFLSTITNIGIMKKQNLNDIQPEQVSHILKSQSWIGLIDRTFLLFRPQQPGYKALNFHDEFQEMVLKNLVDGKDWFPQFNKDEIRCFEE